MSFSQLNLDTHISKAIQVCGYKSPTPIQEKSIPSIISGKDLVACAQTGTGKTAAFILPALQRLCSKKAGRDPRILILTPTRELAAQITEAARRYGKFLRFNIISLVGGMSYRQQIRDLSRAVDIIVATPGRLMDHMDSGRVNLSSIEMLVLDEADRMLDMGFIDDVKFIAKQTPEQRQTLLFSATIDKQLSQVIKQILKNPTYIDLSSEKLTPTLIHQELYMADNHNHKNKILLHLLENKNIFKGIIFSATKINADRLAADLSDKGFPAAPLHGDLKQNVRTRTVEKLRRGNIQFLVATDVAARGIDISDVSHVINYDLPKFSEDYVHRIGRTGRAGKEGVAISLACSMDNRHIQKIERLVKQTLIRKTIEGLEPKQTSNSNHSNPNQKKRSFKKPFSQKSKPNNHYANDERKRYFSKDRNENSPIRDDRKRYFSKDGNEKNQMRDERKRYFSKDKTENYQSRNEGNKEKRFGKKNSERHSFKSESKKPFRKSFGKSKTNFEFESKNPNFKKKKHFGKKSAERAN